MQGASSERLEFLNSTQIGVQGSKTLFAAAARSIEKPDDSPAIQREPKVRRMERRYLLVDSGHALHERLASRHG